MYKVSVIKRDPTNFVILKEKRNFLWLENDTRRGTSEQRLLNSVFSLMGMDGKYLESACQQLYSFRPPRLSEINIDYYNDHFPFPVPFSVFQCTRDIDSSRVK